MRTLAMTLLCLLALAAPAAAVPGWLPATDGLARSVNTLEPSGAAFLADGTLLTLTRFQAAGGSAVVTERPAGGPVRAPAVLDPTGDRAIAADLAADATGATAAVAWVADHAADNSRRVRVATRAADGTWSAPVTLATDPGLADVAVGVRADGGVAALWRTGTAAALKVPGFDPVQLSAGGTTPDALDLAVDGAGVVYGAANESTGMGDTLRVRPVAPGANPATATTTTYPTPGGVGDVAVTPVAGGALTAFPAFFVNDAVVQTVVHPDGSHTDFTSLSDETAEGEIGAAAGAAGDEVVCWRTSAKVLRVARRAPGASAFGPPVSVSGTMTAGAEGRCAVDTTGTTTAAWFEGGRLLAARSPRGEGWSLTATLLQEAAPVYFASTRTALAVGPTGDVAVEAGSLFLNEGSRTESRIIGYDAVAPTAPVLTLPATAAPGRPVAMTMAAFDVWSWAGSWDFGDGTTAPGATATHAYAAPGSYVVRGTATDALGQATSTAQTIEVSAPATGAGPATAPAAPSPATRPRKRAAGTVRGRFRVRGRRTAVVSLVVRGLPKHARVRVRCRRCGKVRTGAVRTKRATKRLRLTARFAHRVLRPGAVITVVVSAPGRRTVRARWTVRAGKAPRRG